MLNESITAYRKIELCRPELLPHTRLYHLEPVGIGTMKVESLSGYIARLAATHCVSPSALCVGEVMPVINQIKLSQKGEVGSSYGQYLNANFYSAAPALNGMGVIAEDWVRAMESLTLHSNLRYLTALTWRNVISIQSWLRPMRTWCPACYQEQKEAGKIVYEQLLWTLKAVTVCCVHRSSLSTLCPHCHKTQPALNATLRPGYCCLCKGWLGVTEHGEPDGLKKDVDFTEQLRITCAIGELLAISPELLETPGRAGITKAINMCLDHFTDGNRAAFARRFGITEMITAKWSRGEFLPRIGTLLKICFLAGAAPINFLYGKVTFIDDETAGVGKHSGVGTPQPSRSRRYADEERALTMALKESPPPSVSTVARRLGYRFTSSIYRHHSAVCQQITERHRLFAQKQRRQKQAERIHDPAEARRICELALVEDTPPLIREVAIRLGYSYKYPQAVGRLCPDLYQLLVPRRLEYDQRATDALLKELQKALREALREEPPPSLLAIAVRCGVDSRQFKSHCPELCRKLAERRTQFKDRRSQEQRGILEAALQEVPIPSLREMAKRIGYQGKNGITRHFPDISREVAARRKELRQQQCEETQWILEQILSETPPPSMQAVCRRLGFEASTLYHKYPTTCHQIATRYMAYSSEMAAKRREQLYWQVRKVVLELHNQGIDPTARRVGDHLHSPSLIRSDAFCEILQALRSELNLP